MAEILGCRLLGWMGSYSRLRTHWAAILMNFLRSCTRLPSWAQRHTSVTTHSCTSLNLLRNKSRLAVVFLKLCRPNVWYMSSCCQKRGAVCQTPSPPAGGQNKKYKGGARRGAERANHLMDTVEELPVVERHLIGQVFGAHQLEGYEGPCGRPFLLWQRSLKCGSYHFTSACCPQIQQTATLKHSYTSEACLNKSD